MAPASADQSGRSRSTAALRRATGRLSTAATARMEAEFPWFRELPAQERSWVGQIVQAGIQSFVDWYSANERGGDTAVVASVFGAAPRALTGVISLRQTVDLIRLSIDVVESHVAEIVRPEDPTDVLAQVMRYGREVAFATAEVYARAAEQRGAWDARLEALVVDSVLRAEPDDTVLSRASALGWGERGAVCVVLGPAPAERAASDLFEEVRRSARSAGMDALCGLQGDHLVVILGGVTAATEAAGHVVGHFGEGAVVAGPVVADLHQAQSSAAEALAGQRAAAGWPQAPRPTSATELLAERAVAGDPVARTQLVEAIFTPISEKPALVDTLSSYFDNGDSLEGAARALFVHPNTVRYRLRQISTVTGLLPTDPHDGLTLRLALMLGRQQEHSAPKL